MPAYDVLTIGNYTKDTIVSMAGTRHVHGGGYSYAAHAAAVRPLAVGAVTRLAAEDRHSTASLTARGVTVHVFESPSSTLMRLEYPTADVDQRILTVAAVAEPLTPDLLADFEARAFLVNGSLRGELPLASMRLLRSKGGLLAADLQGFIRIRADDGRLSYAPWPEQRAVLALVDILKTDAVEAEFLTGTADHRRAAAALAALGPAEVVLTHKDGLLVLADGTCFEAPFRPDELRGRSGRGDTCIGAYASARLDLEPADATLWAAATTSLKLEREGPVQASAADVRRVLDERYREGVQCARA
jgi:sugar/nucleoside kinase (ribokinase family)